MTRKGTEMKAWIVGPGYESYIALVYADTRGKARAALAGYYGEDEFVDMRARRCPQMDGKWEKAGVCEDEALMVESGEFWVCEEHRRMADEDRRCDLCCA